MKYLTTILLFFYVFELYAQQIKLNYSKALDPFKWTVSQIEIGPNETLVSVRVKNLANNTRVISFNHPERAFSENFPQGIYSTKNSYFVKNTLLKSYEEISFVLTFPSNKLGFSKEFNLYIGGHFMLKDIKIPELSLSDLNKQMLIPWDKYYESHKRTSLSHKDIDEVKQSIMQKVENWQKKGEFESTSAWQTRVNDITRQQYISKITSDYSAQHEKEINEIKQEQVELAEQYEKYKLNLLNTYYQYKINIAKNHFFYSDFELKPYDADNETFLIHAKYLGDILLPVPVDEAPSFKQNWIAIRQNIKPEYIPYGEDVILNKIIFTNGNKSYIYDKHTIANYAITDVNYNFAPIDIPEINFDNIEINGISVIPENENSPVLTLSHTEKPLVKNNYTPQLNKISASNKSDIDTSIPQNAELKNSTTFAVIIANENYNNVSSVPYAKNDGEILTRYLINTIGLPKDHVKVYNNATYGNMVAAFKHIDNLSLAFGENLNLILYYTGHGVPNEQTKKCMFLPTDGDATIPETCYDADKLYTTLGGYNANSIIILIDACFSGSTRGDDMLFASRGVKIKSNNSEPQGNMVILSASQGDETAYPFDKEQHGMFTYYLLKYIQENNGNIILGQLSEYLIEQVKRQSVVSNGKLQTPMVQVGKSIKDIWKNLKLGR